MRVHGTAVCAHCGTVFAAPPSSRRIYCANACYWAHRPSLMAERFWPKVRKTDGCWLWAAAISKRHGYGKFGDGLKADKAHRVAWILASGKPIPAGMFVCHTCDNRRCVRNDDHGTYVVDDVTYERRGHLFLARHKGNGVDMAEKGRSTIGERNAQAKLTDMLVARIKQQYAAGGVTQEALAQQTGVSRRCVGKVISGETWRHV
jgi:hypothetical protein